MTRVQKTCDAIWLKHMYFPKHLHTSGIIAGTDQPEIPEAPSSEAGEDDDSSDEEESQNVNSSDHDIKES
jgi:hypothetical protein